MDEVIITLAITYLGLSLLDLIDKVKVISKTRYDMFDKTH